MTTLPLYALLHDYLHHCWNVTSITSSIVSVRDALFNGNMNKPKKKVELAALYPTHVKELSDVADFFTPSTNEHTQTPSHRGLFSSVTPHYRAPRKPIVLCHGLYGFDRMGPEHLPSFQVHYWNEIEKALCDLGAKVIVTRVPKTESISNRAYALHSILSSIMVDKEVNFIAHSMVR